ncbi:RRM_1 domain-containing protein/Big_2 domain-containing protein [Cephalotus follicularis]|uniref:RRM_1 domain-containing protein/Big_2 domain-containing protein n=1 Tax=Cephalotus follicularis TaxID=3775 RepID=A0A1Q3BKK7_CEPFO|nr:RRM_1 domain-containing protein/Big_2 domain-containing protein [Cephalotus follicularis]
MIRLLLWFVFLLLTEREAASHLSSGPHIADVNVLLPPKMTHPVEYRLQGSDGCFKWSWDHHDVLSVQPEFNGSSQCSTSARLRSIAPYSGRKETAVYAADVQTGIVIRCKVFIDNFSRIQIFHNSIKLDLDGLATLRVRAFDNEENVFSSLVGIQFMWQLIPESSGLPHHLIHVPLKDSPLSDSGGWFGDLDIQIKLENSGVFSDLFVVQGIGIGQESVSVHLVEPKYKHMGDKIVLTVAEAMSLDPPSPVFVLIGASFRYSLKVIRGNIPQVVSLPSTHHRWYVSNSSVARVDVAIGLTDALNLGVTAVIVEDTRVAGHTQLSSLNVVLPDALFLFISPFSISGDPVLGMKANPSLERWYVVSGCQYLVQVKVFSQGLVSQEIYITENDDIKLNDNQSEFWKTLMVPDDIVAKQGWRYSRILKATSQGLGELTASLTYFSGNYDTKEVLKVAQEVMVCDQVKFRLDRTSGISQSILLPWAPAVYQEVELKATGGCAKTYSDYRWFSSDMATVSISVSGIVQAKKPGNATVKVVSVFDSLNYDELVIEVSIPSSMVMLHNFPVETVVGSHLQAAVTMKESTGHYFYSCDAFNSFINWKAGSELFVVVNATKEMLDLEKKENIELHASVYGPPCSWTYVYASGSGRTMLHATLSKEYLHFDHPSHGPVVLKASSRIAAYPQLSVHQAGDGSQFGGYWFDLGQAEASSHPENLDKLYLVPGAHIDVMLLGGPEQWDKGVDFIETVEILDGKHVHVGDEVHVHQIYASSRSLYRILCEALGTVKLVFKRGNLVGADHPLPAIAEVLLSVTCSIPSSIALIVDEPVNEHAVIRTAIQADRSPGRIRVTPVTVANGQIIRAAAVGISESGEAFANSSSLYLRWELSSCDDLAYWDDTYNSQRSKSSWEQFLALRNESGLCIVRATVIGFGDTDDHSRAQLLESSENFLTDAIRLQIVSTLKVNPEFNLLFFNPNAKVNLSISGGSCFLEVVVNDSRVVEVIQPPPGLQCLQLMLSPKGLGISLVTVYDIGLAPPLTASAMVQVADVDWIKIVSREEISLMEGKSHSIDVMAGTSDGNAFVPSQFAYMNIHVHIEDDIVELVDNDDIPIAGGRYINMPSFRIRAKHLGVTTLYVSARQHSGHEIVSQQIKVEVYMPPKIQPRDVFLVPGAHFMVSVKGGPTVGVFVQYSSMDNQTATVHRSSGQLSAISPGNTTILATVYGNGDIVICRASGSVEVGVPSSVLLNVQSEQLTVGHEMPIFPSFPEARIKLNGDSQFGDLFSFYELCKNYKWTVEDEKVLSFREIEQLHSQKHMIPFASNEVQFSRYLDDKELGFIKVLYARLAGRANVAVTFSCDFISGSYSQSRMYNASVLLSVVSDLPLALGVPITWVLPPYYTTSGVLPTSLDSHSQGDSHSRKGTVIYSVLQDCGSKNEVEQKDAISIDGNRIKTTESNNLACIQAKDRSTGRIEIASCVRVAEVAQIRIIDKDFPLHIIDLAVGAELDIPICYRDSLGNPFYEAHNILLCNVETNYHDIVSIDNTNNGCGNIRLKAMRNGRALVRVSINNNPQKSDYMLVSVGAHVYPQNPVLHVGSRLNFSVEGFDDRVFGRWLSANESVLSVDMASGKAQAIGIGSTRVVFECPNTKVQTTVTVVSRNIVFVDAPTEMLTNVPFPTKGYTFPVKFSDSYDALEVLGNGKGISYDCKVDPPFIGYAKPWMDLHTGHLFCLLFPYSPEHLVHSIPKSKDMKPYVSVAVSASLREANHVSGSASALFIGGFSILEMDKLNLTPDSNQSILTILGNTDVEIHWIDRDSIKISPIHREDFGIGGRAQYEVKVLSAKRLKDKIIITLPANGQRVEIDVTFQPGGRSAAETILHGYFGRILLGLVIVPFIVAIILYLKRPNEFPASISPATPNMAVPLTPVHSSPPVLNKQSPQTPQPFVEYVRRTIDETPYYRREARRRKIFIGGLARDTTPAQFVKHFGKYGEITDSVIMKDRKTGQPRGFGFVTYADPAVVDNVIQETHAINGKQVEIKRTIPKGAIGSKDFKTKKIFVGGIPSTVNEDEFKHFFSHFGEVREHQIMVDNLTSRSRGFGFITFETEQAVDDLLAQGSKLELSGSQVEIKKAEPKKPNPPLPSTKRYKEYRPPYGSGYGDAYGGFGGGGFGSSGVGYRSGGAHGSRSGASYGGYSGADFGGYGGGYGGGNLGAYRGEPSPGYSGRCGGGFSRGYDLGGGYGGPGDSYGGFGTGTGPVGGYGSSYDADLGGGYGGNPEGNLFGSRGGYGGYGGTGSGRYHPYGR